MSSISERVAREHRSYGGLHCACGHLPGKDEPINDARTRHIAAVTEALTREQVAAEIQTAIYPEWVHAARAEVRHAFASGMSFVARIAKGGEQP